MRHPGWATTCRAATAAAAALFGATAVGRVPAGAANLAPVVSIGNVRIVEGDSSVRVAAFSVTLSRRFHQDVLVPFRTTGGTAGAGTDFQARSDAVTIPAGRRSAVVGVLVSGDRRGEGNETFKVTLGFSENAQLGRSVATGTIIDDDRASSAARPPSVSVGDASVVEGHYGPRYVYVPVTLSATTRSRVAVRYRTKPVAASSRWGDFVTRSGVTYLPAGTTSVRIPVVVSGDLRGEADEAFRLDLTYSVGATIRRSRGTVVIIDDDVPTSLVAWGQNFYGQLGDSSSVDRHSPTYIGAATNWIDMSAGSEHSCGIRAPGALWCWGRNEDGRVGDGSTDNRDTPVRTGNAGDWTAVSAGGYHTCGIRAPGSLWCWGDNQVGQLGDGTTDDATSPRRIGVASDWLTVSAGGYHTCGIRAPGKLWCWGLNNDGQTGDGTTEGRWVPTRVGSLADWTDVSAGFAHACATRGSGTLWCWGDNNDVQLGDGTTSDRHVPTRVGHESNWNSISAGVSHTCGRRGANAWCWGVNGDGQVGDGTTTPRNTPAPVAGAWREIAAGGQHTCGVRTDGSLWCWGWNHWGNLGDGTTTDRHSPTRIGTSNSWAQVEAGDKHTLARQAGYG